MKIYDGFQLQRSSRCNISKIQTENKHERQNTEKYSRMNSETRRNERRGFTRSGATGAHNLWKVMSVRTQRTVMNCPKSENERKLRLHKLFGSGGYHISTTQTAQDRKFKDRKRPRPRSRSFVHQKLAGIKHAMNDSFIGSD